MSDDVTGLFVNMHGQTYHLQLTPFDSDGHGNAVWQANVEGDTRYIEAPLDVDLWKLVDSVVHCYESDEDGFPPGSTG